MASRVAFAQQPDQVRSVGMLIGLAEGDPDVPRRIAVFQQELHELGWIENRNIKLTYRLASNPEQMRAFAKELIAAQPDVVVASSSVVVAILLRETRTIPIVFVSAADPVGDGFVASLARPGGNATGFTNNLASMGGKWLELLIEVAPGTARVAVMFNSETAPGKGAFFLRPIEAAAALRSTATHAMPVRDDAEIANAIAAFGRNPGGALIVMPDNFTSVHRAQIIASAAQHRVPAIYPFRYFTTGGGLMSYGADLVDLYRRTPAYVDRILRGAKPADLPVQAPAKVELVINLKAARSFGLTVPRIMLARADEVIE
jgi:putative ABC transport system substrate-binding protein